MTKKELEKVNREMDRELLKERERANKYELIADAKQISLNATIGQLHATEEALTKALDLVGFLRPPKKRETVAYAFQMNVANHEGSTEKQRS